MNATRNGDRRRPRTAYLLRPTAEEPDNTDAANGTAARSVAAAEADALRAAYDAALEITTRRMRAGLVKDTPAQDFCLSGPGFDLHVVSFRNRSWDSLRWRHVYEMHAPWPTWSGAITVQQWMAGAGPDFKLLQARIEQYDLCLLAATAVRALGQSDGDPETDYAVDPSATFLFPVPIDGDGRLGLCVGVEFADGQVSFASDVPATFLPGAFEFHLNHLSVLP